MQRILFIYLNAFELLLLKPSRTFVLKQSKQIINGDSWPLLKLNHRANLIKMTYPSTNYYLILIFLFRHCVLFGRRRGAAKRPHVPTNHFRSRPFWRFDVTDNSHRFNRQLNRFRVFNLLRDYAVKLAQCPQLVTITNLASLHSKWVSIWLFREYSAFLSIVP